jgi:hypothetical protein
VHFIGRLPDIQQKIKDYNQEVIKNRRRCALEICPRCQQKPPFFKRHDVRQRKLRIIVERLILSVLLLLVRRKCPQCGKTFTDYPPFAWPYKRYVSHQIIERSLRYLQEDTTSYEQATRELDPGQQNGRSPPWQPMPVCHQDMGCARQFAPSTVHRWITTLGSMKNTLQAAMNLLLEKGSDIHRQACDLPARKYRSQERKRLLQDCLMLFHTEARYRILFGCSIFPELAISCCWQ